jgi:DNA-binding MarR family transcriptional regulator
MKTPFSDQETSRLAALSDALGAWQSVLSLPQVLALIEIAMKPGLSVNELAERLRQPQQTVSRHVAVLLGRYQTPETMEAGVSQFIRQEISAADPRRRALFLSDDGLALLKALGSDRPTNVPSKTKAGKVP